MASRGDFERIDFAAMYRRVEFVDAGGLVVYGPSYNDLFRHAAGYVDKTLRGATGRIAG